MRSYGVPDTGDAVFVELKKKYDGVVYKRRVTAPLPQVAPFLAGRLAAGAFGQIGREIDWFQRRNHALPKAFIAYDRAAFAGLDNDALRVTLDTSLRWRSEALDLTRGDWGQPLLPEDAVLMEVKLPIYPTSYSKYGACYLEHLLPALQKNGWEEQFCA